MNREVNRVLLLGASLDTGNLGVSALAWSSIKLILQQWCQAEVVLLGGGRQCDQIELQIDGKRIQVKSVPVRYCINLFAANHFLGLFLDVLLARIGLARFNPALYKTRDYVLSADLFMDITGGDSFSDIYGMKRFILGWLSKKLCQMTGKPFIMLPQTYGPFQHRITRWMASNILRNSSKLFSRDKQSVEEIRALIGEEKPIEVVPDVAFIMDPIRQESEQITQLEKLKVDNYELIGLNVSGLLYNGGYKGQNEFGLKCDYTKLLRKVISFFFEKQKAFIIIVPHVIPVDCEVENDLLASQNIWETLPAEQKNKVIVLDGNYTQNQVKHLIGLCDFFIGSRMHSTIAALSQCIPAVGMAYSNKFIGVFETAGVADCVIDLRQMDEEDVLFRIERLYTGKAHLIEKLRNVIPEMKSKLLHFCEAVK